MKRTWLLSLTLRESPRPNKVLEVSGVSFLLCYQSGRHALVAEITQQMVRRLACRQSVFEMSDQFSCDINLLLPAQKTLIKHHLDTFLRIERKFGLGNEPEGFTSLVARSRKDHVDRDDVGWREARINLQDFPKARHEK